MRPSFKAKSTFKYNLFVNTDNSTLASEFRVFQSEPGVGHPLRLTAFLTEAGKPLQGLSPGSVRAVLSRPKASLGNVLSNARVEPLRAQHADLISAAGRKASAMMAHPDLRKSILDALKPGIDTVLVLKEQKPGFYEANYHDTGVAGIYSVHFQVNGEAATNGKFSRTFTTASSINVMPDARATLDSLRVSTIVPCSLAGGCYAITLKPVDVHGNLLGPGKASLLNITEFAGRILNPISDELDGRYTIRIGYPKPRTENPVVNLPGARLTVELGEPVNRTGQDGKNYDRP
jgi:hypothetical protein